MDRWTRGSEQELRESGEPILENQVLGLPLCLYPHFGGVIKEDLSILPRTSECGYQIKLWR